MTDNPAEKVKTMFTCYGINHQYIASLLKIHIDKVKEPEDIKFSLTEIKRINELWEILIKKLPLRKVQEFYNRVGVAIEEFKEFNRPALEFPGYSNKFENAPIKDIFKIENTKLFTQNTRGKKLCTRIYFTLMAEGIRRIGDLINFAKQYAIPRDSVKKAFLRIPGMGNKTVVVVLKVLENPKEYWMPCKSDQSD